MKKPAGVFLIVLVFLACGAVAASAATKATVVGTWAINGTATITVDVNDATSATASLQFASINISFPHVWLMNEQFTFGTVNPTTGKGSFSDALLGIAASYAGTYTISKSNAFTIDIGDPQSGTAWSGWLGQMQSEIPVLLGTFLGSAQGMTVTVSHATFKGTLVSAKSITGSINVLFNVTDPNRGVTGITIPVTITATLSGTPATVASSPKTAGDAAAFMVEKVLAPALSFSGN